MRGIADVMTESWDYFYNLSETDFPIQPIEKVRQRAVLTFLRMYMKHCEIATAISCCLTGVISWRSILAGMSAEAPTFSKHTAATPSLSSRSRCDAMR